MSLRQLLDFTTPERSALKRFCFYFAYPFFVEDDLCMSRLSQSSQCAQTEKSSPRFFSCILFVFFLSIFPFGRVVSAGDFDKKPVFIPFHLEISISSFDGYIPKRNTVMKTDVVPQWKQLWDQARSAFHSNHLEQAVQFYEMVLQEKEELLDVREEFIVLLLRLGRLVQASAHIEKVLERQPDNEILTYSQAILVQSEKQYERSIELFRRLDNSGFADEKMALKALANGYFALGEYKKCIAVLKELLLQTPSELVKRNFALVAYRLEHYNEALPYILQLAENEDDGAEFLLLAAQLLQRSGRLDEAATLWNRIFQMDSEHMEACRHLATYYESKGQAGAALPYLEFLWKISRDDATLRRLGNVYLALKKYPEAVRTFEQYHMQYPEDVAVVRSLIQVYAGLGDKENTLRMLEHYFALEAHPGSENLRKAAQLYDEQGFYREAIPLYKKLLTLTPDDPNLLWALAGNLLALGRDEDSLEVWQKLAAVAPSVVEVYRPMAELLKRLGRLDELVRVLNVIHQLDPEDHEVIYELAELAYKRKDFDACLVFLDKFTSEMRRLPEYFMWRGMALEWQGNIAGALASYQELLKLKSHGYDVLMRAMHLAGLLGKNAFLETHAETLLVSRDSFLVQERLVLGDGFLRSRLFERARQEFQMALHALSESSQDAQDIWQKDVVRIYKGIADSYIGEERLYEAEQVIRQAYFSFRGEMKTLFAERLFSMALQQQRLEDATYWLEVFNKETAVATWLSQLMEVRLLAKKDFSDGQDGAEFLLSDFIQQGNIKDVPVGHVVEFTHLLIELDLLDQAYDLCGILRAEERNDIVLDVLEEHIYIKSNGVVGQKNQRDYSRMELSNLRQYADLFLRYDLGQELEAVCFVALDRDPTLFWAKDLLGLSYRLQGKWQDALTVYEGLTSKYPEKSQPRLNYARVAFHLGKFEDALRVCATIKGDSFRADILELRARIYWMQHRWDEAVTLYEQFLVPTVDQILLAKADEIGFQLPAREDTRSFWDIVSFIPNEGNSITAKVMAPHFFENTPPFKREEMQQLSASQYARYRWQDKFAEELKARRSVQRREYFFAAKQYERFLQRYPADLSMYYDLAGVYSRLGRTGDEEALYRYLTDHKVKYPDLSENIARIAIKQRPYGAFFYDYDRLEGRHGYQNIEKIGYGLRVWQILGQKTEVDIVLSRFEYTAPDQDQSATGNEFLGTATFRPWAGLSSSVFLGFHNLLHREADSILFGSALGGKLGDKLSGKVAVKRDIVDDTVASLTRKIIKDSFDAGLTLDILPNLEVGGDYFYTNYSDNNWTTGYDFRSAYTLFSEPTFFQLRYNYDFKESLEGPIGGSIAQDGFASDDHPYWAPSNYWRNSFGAYFKHTLGADILNRGVPRYYTLEYLFGHDADGYAFQELKGELYLEVSPEFFISSACQLASSQQYRRKQISMTAHYRW